MSIFRIGLTILLVIATFLVTYVVGVYRKSSKSTTNDTETDQRGSTAVKKQTEKWSEEAAINPAFPPGQEPPGGTSSRPNLSIRDQGSGDLDAFDAGLNDKQTELDLSDMEFNWRVETGVEFDDVGGMESLKNELRDEIIRPLVNPKKAEDLGVAAPNVIFYGPPGTGKTYMAKALASELGLPFVMLSGADLQSKWINESATKVNMLFREAQEIAAGEGGAVVFLDELDSVLKSRSAEGASHEEDNKVVNEFLAHLEDTKDFNVVVIGATNRLDALDDAGIRSGRIDLKIHIGKPDTKAREAILRAQLNDRKNDITDTGIAELAAATEGAAAADLELLINRAAKNVLARNGDAIQWVDIVTAVSTSSA